MIKLIAAMIALIMKTTLRLVKNQPASKINLRVYIVIPNSRSAPSSCVLNPSFQTGEGTQVTKNSVSMISRQVKAHRTPKIMSYNDINRVLGFTKQCTQEILLLCFRLL